LFPGSDQGGAWHPFVISFPEEAFRFILLDVPRRFQLQASEETLSPAALKMRMLQRLRCTLRFEKAAWKQGARVVAGVDEVGRGSLFGPVVAAAVILHPEDRIRGLKDSKLLQRDVRERLAAAIRKRAIALAFAAVDHVQIDAVNIYQASRLAMLQAVEQLPVRPDHLLVDAMVLDTDCPQTRIIYGDALSASIAAASIIAKVERDRMMQDLDSVYPGYDLASNKGYGTPKHVRALRDLGPTPMHRRSFAPVWDAEHPQEELFVGDDEKVLKT
jgi:ribonuclease HII